MYPKLSVTLCIHWAMPVSERDGSIHIIVTQVLEASFINITGIQFEEAKSPLYVDFVQ